MFTIFQWVAVDTDHLQLAYYISKCSIRHSTFDLLWISSRIFEPTILTSVTTSYECTHSAEPSPQVRFGKQLENDSVTDKEITADNI